MYKTIRYMNYTSMEVAMRKLYLLLSISSTLLFFSCQKKDDSQEIVSQRFVHKYGLDLSAEEWEKREKDGQVITVLDNGVTVTNTFTNGILHGNTTFTYPDSEVLEQLLVYDEGSITKKIMYDEASIPIMEEVYDLDDRKTVTRWNRDGVPLSVEEYDNDVLIKGEYFDKKNECESTVAEGSGYRTRRDRDNILLSKDTFQDGELVHRTTFHANGTIQSENPYHNYLLHGKQISYSESGKPLMEAIWQEGQLDGMKYLYTNGQKTAEIPYASGKKHGVERHFDTNSNLVAEIQWDNDFRHGSSRFYGEEDTKIDWFYKGQNVSLKKFQMMEFREKLMAELRGEEKDEVLKEMKNEDSVVK